MLQDAVRVVQKSLEVARVLMNSLQSKQRPKHAHNEMKKHIEGCRKNRKYYGISFFFTYLNTCSQKKKETLKKKQKLFCAHTHTHKQNKNKTKHVMCWVCV